MIITISNGRNTPSTRIKIIIFIISVTKITLVGTSSDDIKKGNILEIDISRRIAGCLCITLNGILDLFQ